MFGASPLGCRASSIATRLQQILLPEYLLTNPFLASSVTPANTMPVACVLADASLIRWRATARDIAMACINLHCDFVASNADPQIRLSYRPLQRELMLRPVDCDHRELFVFLRSLTDASDISLAKVAGGFVARFRHTLHAYALWRALAYVPFRGRLVDVALNAKLVEKEDRLQTANVEPSKQIETKSRGRGRRRRARKRRQNADRNGKWTWSRDSLGQSGSLAESAAT
jgi:hypothetical protein